MNTAYYFLIEEKKISLNYPHLAPDLVLNPQWLERPMSRTNFHRPKDVRAIEDRLYTRVLQKVLSLRSDYFSATFYQTYFYYKPSKYSPFTETHFCNLFTQSRKADK